MGIGLRGINSITMEMYDVIKKSDLVYFDIYTSISPDKTFEDLIKINANTLKATRDVLENEGPIIERAVTENITIVVTGDALSATTHNQIRRSAIEKGIDVNIYENASIITAFPSRTGLFIYRFGSIVSMPFTSDKFFPLSVYDKIYKNYINNMHTLILLDLKDGRTMPINDALNNLLAMEDKKHKGLIKEDTLLFAGIKIGSCYEKIYFSNISKMLELDIEDSPASIIIPAELNEIELEFARSFCINVF
nr:diphthine synthase [Picrophilus oshimae]